MDFFANAFVTRDVVDNENVVVKDGIQIREKTMAISDDVVKCEVCGLATAKYKCPGCFCQTCSLQCSKQHKLDTTCSGARPRTHFVERKQYSEQDMMSDYNFLEEVGRTVDNAARQNLELEAGLHLNKKRNLGANNNNKRARHPHDNKGGSDIASITELSLTAAQELERQVPENSGTYKDKQLIMQARRRGTQLIRMAEGLKKRKENNTHWRDKPSRILWTIEWLFPKTDSPRRVLEHKNEESSTLKDLLSGALSKEDKKDLTEIYHLDQLDQYRLYFVIPLRHANKPALYPLKNTDSLQEALKFKKVLEYPTILVLEPSSLATISTSKETAFAEAVKESTDTAANGETKTESVRANVSTESISSSDTATQANISDQSHPILKKYSIEEPPTQFPKRNPGPQQKQQNNKRHNDRTTESDTANKKAKVEEKDEEGEGDNDEEEDEEEESSSDDSSDDSDDSDEDSSSDDSSDSDTTGAEAEDADASPDDDSGVPTTGTEGDVDADNEPNMEVGQAILEAFNQDFGQAK